MLDKPRESIVTYRLLGGNPEGTQQLPLWVQPHLKKCFESISKLYYTEDTTITVISSEKEARELVAYMHTERLSLVRL